jgi:hypothetical protein
LRLIQANVRSTIHRLGNTSKPLASDAGERLAIRPGVKKDAAKMNEGAQLPGSDEPRAARRRAALYLRVSTGRQAEHDLSIPDQRRQLRSWFRANGHEVVAELHPLVTIGARASSR